MQLIEKYQFMPVTTGICLWFILWIGHDSFKKN